MGSPGSGFDGQYDDLSGVSHSEAIVMLTCKVREVVELQNKCLELEKMVDERDEEIIELMTDFNKIQEQAPRESTPEVAK